MTTNVLATGRLLTVCMLIGMLVLLPTHHAAAAVGDAGTVEEVRTNGSVGLTINGTHTLLRGTASIQDQVVHARVTVRSSASTNQAVQCSLIAGSAAAGLNPPREDVSGTVPPATGGFSFTTIYLTLAASALQPPVPTWVPAPAALARDHVGDLPVDEWLEPFGQRGHDDDLLRARHAHEAHAKLAGSGSAPLQTLAPFAAWLARASAVLSRRTASCSRPSAR